MSLTRTGSGSPDQKLRKLLVVKARAKFKTLFRVEYDPAWGSSFLAYLEHLKEQDLAARRAAANLRRTPNRARAVVAQYGLDKNLFQPGTAPALIALAEIACLPTDEMKEWFISDDPIVGQKPTYSLRIAVISFFEAVPAMSEVKTGSFADLGRWKADGCNDRRVLTDSELVAIMVCIDPQSVTLTEEDAVGDLDASAKGVLVRERRLVKEARERKEAREEKMRLHPRYPRDFETVKRPRTKADREAERSKKAVLPWPQGRTTSVSPLP